MLCYAAGRMVGGVESARRRPVLAALVDRGEYIRNVLPSPTLRSFAKLYLPFAVPLSARGPLTPPDPCQPPSLPLLFPIVLLARERSIDLNFFPRSNREP
ncbi:hypothetical protein ALC60_10992 [Trachymyrmex zeteki]|uniref:Uncharacterized protein n=1 Tax=Mycetomoellerius zeteki TaxID=64791 RepID=A0A151WPZ0_9HYME|nr:hypothetical protein ALC60_10992 [Trachymyrmex zeteki]